MQLIFQHQLFAQLSPSSALLIRPRSASSSQNLDSGRYATRPDSSPAKKVNRDTANSDVAPEAPALNEAQSKPSTAKAKEKPKVENTEKQNELQKEKSFAESDRDTVQKLRELFFGGDEETIEKYKEKIHPEDPRHNIASLTIAPTFLYLDSSSQYWFRDYYSSGPGLTVGTDIWATPFLGAYLDYFSTLAAEMDVDTASPRRALVEHRYGQGGFQFRRFSTQSRRSPSFTLTIGYSEYKLNVPKEETERISLSSSGVAIGFHSKIPKSAFDALTFGVTFFPKQKITETRSGTDVKSGTDNTSFAIEASIGKEFTLDKHNQIFVKINHRLDKTVYEGTANTNDPRTGTAPEGVSVNSNMTLFSLGYTWGD